MHVYERTCIVEMGFRAFNNEDGFFFIGLQSAPLQGLHPHISHSRQQAPSDTFSNIIKFSFHTCLHMIADKDMAMYYGC
jgi:hypothetical protein